MQIFAVVGNSREPDDIDIVVSGDEQFTCWLWLKRVDEIKIICGSNFEQVSLLPAHEKS